MLLQYATAVAEVVAASAEVITTGVNVVPVGIDVAAAEVIAVGVDVAVAADVDYAAADVDYVAADVDYAAADVDYVAADVDYAAADVDYAAADVDYAAAVDELFRLCGRDDDELRAIILSIVDPTADKLLAVQKVISVISENTYALIFNDVDSRIECELEGTSPNVKRIAGIVLRHIHAM
jgi:hypothetical protein